MKSLGSRRKYGTGRKDKYSDGEIDVREEMSCCHCGYPYVNTNAKSCPHCGKSLLADEKTLIFDDENLRGGFAQTPNVILKDPNLTPYEKTLYSLLLAYAWDKESCWPGQGTLAGHLGCTREYVGKIMRQLKVAGLVDWKRRGQGKVNIYHIRRLTDAYPQMRD